MSNVENFVDNSANIDGEYIVTKVGDVDVLIEVDVLVVDLSVE